MSGTKDNGEKDKKEKAATDTKPGPTCPPVRNVTHPLRYYEFTQEEMKALEECDRESFYRRCLPFSTLLATATYTAIKCELLNRNPHFGALPKVMVAAFVGYVWGRVSYMSNCDEKLRKLPANSHLGNVMRKYYADSLAFEAEVNKKGDEK
ncbi:OCIA domain-containing protein 1-like [Trichoplusia ni]|uniref:OCIA domain-containing protein 1-like n=1 Tax=Trichoplusia ni TaxID=7111 RepID=A0A7E5WNA9_TRINI|nr:OCIA domain-containing protein 1-like [Trichoplusia ni]